MTTQTIPLTSVFSVRTKDWGCECIDISHLRPAPSTLFDENTRFYAVLRQPLRQDNSRRRPRGGTRLADVIAELSDSAEGSASLKAGRQWVADSFYADEPQSLQALRLRKGFSQADLAKAIGVSQPRVSIYERGLEKPEFDMLVRLRKALDVTTDQLFSAIEHAATRRELQHA